MLVSGRLYETMNFNADRFVLLNVQTKSSDFMYFQKLNL